MALSNESKRSNSILVVCGLAALIGEGCATLSPKPDPFTDEATMSVNMARELGGTIGVNGNRTVIINCLRGSSPVESTNKLDDLNGSVLPGAKKADAATGELGKQDYLTCVKSVVEAAPSAPPPPEKAETVEQAKTTLLNKFKIDLNGFQEGFQKDGSYIRFAVTDDLSLMDPAELEKKVFPDGLRVQFVDKVLLADGRYVIIGKAFKSAKARPENESGGTVELEDIKITKVPTSISDQFVSLIRKNMGEITACHSRALKSDPNLTGTLRIAAQIGPNGKIARVQFPKKGKPLNNPYLEGCIASIIKRFSFEPGNQCGIEFPLVLKAGD